MAGRRPTWTPTDKETCDSSGVIITIYCLFIAHFAISKMTNHNVFVVVGTSNDRRQGNIDGRRVMLHSGCGQTSKPKRYMLSRRVRLAQKLSIRSFVITNW
jgi:hypothetical protein